MKNDGLLIVLSGFSGSGKGTVMKRLMEKYPGEYALSVSATTRSPREGEREGIEYFFKTQDEFEEMIANDELLEYARYVEHYYGTPKFYVEDKRRSGINVFLEIEIQGALKIKEKFPDTLLIFLVPPSIPELAGRLRGRGTESEDVVKARLSQARVESGYMDRYDYIVVNDDLEMCVEQVHDIVQVQKFQAKRSTELISRLQHQLDDFLKGENV